MVVVVIIVVVSPKINQLKEDLLIKCGCACVRVSGTETAPRQQSAHFALTEK